MKPLYSSEDNTELETKMKNLENTMVEESKDIYFEKAIKNISNSEEVTLEKSEDISTTNKPNFIFEETVKDIKEHIDSVEVDKLKEIENTGATVLSVANPEMFKNIKDIFNNGKVISEKPNYIFTTGKGKIDFNFDDTIFVPTKLVLLSGRSFEKKYIEQLKSILFNKNEELNTEHLISLIYIIDLVEKKILPISIKTGIYKNSINKIVNGMNTFFIENYSTLKSINVMFKGSDIFRQQEQKDAANGAEQ